MNWITLSLISLGLNTIAIIMISRLGKKMNTNLMTAYLYSSLGVFLLIVNFLFLGNSLIVPFNLFLPLLGIGLIGGFAYMLFYTSLSIAPNPGYPSAVFSINLIVVTLISAFILGTEITLLKFSGVLVAVVGMVLMSLSKQD